MTERVQYVPLRFGESADAQLRRRDWWWGLSCWNGLSAEQQTRLIEVGNLPLGYVPEGTGCSRGAQVAVETEDDRADGPRFYCRQCAASYVLRLESP